MKVIGGMINLMGEVCLSMQIRINLKEYLKMELKLI